MADGTARGTTVLTDGESDGFVPMFAFFDAVKEPFIDRSGSVKSSGDKEFTQSDEMPSVAAEPRVPNADAPGSITDTDETSTGFLLAEADLVGTWREHGLGSLYGKGDGLAVDE
jgi:hypothetical protein